MDNFFNKQLKIMRQNMRKQLFEKIGRKYTPVNDPNILDGLENGEWLVIVKPNSTSVRVLLNPEFVVVEPAHLVWLLGSFSQHRQH